MLVEGDERVSTRIVVGQDRDHNRPQWGETYRSGTGPAASARGRPKRVARPHHERGERGITGGRTSGLTGAHPGAVGGHEVPLLRPGLGHRAEEGVAVRGGSGGRRAALRRFSGGLRGVCG